MVSTDVLERFSIFSGLDRKVLENMARACSVHPYRAQEEVFTEGDRAEDFYMLLNGRISIERRLSQSWLRAEGISDAIIHTQRDGEVFGWSALVEPGIMTASARCVEDSEVVQIKGRQLLDILDGNCDAGYTFMKRLATVIASRLTETAQRLTDQTAEVETYRVM